MSKYDLIRATLNVLEVAENESMAKTTKERQEDFRARRAMLDGAQEVRGIFLPPDLHAELKKLAAELAQRIAPRGKKDGKS